jgi:nucleotide-binding universal stress UspA family protein
VLLLVLVDGLHNEETFAALSRLVGLQDAAVLLVFVRSPGPRAGLDLVRRRPGGHRLPPHREHELSQAELEAGAGALVEAERLARASAASVETMQVSGEPGRTVCELAARRNVDLVVIRAGGRDRPPLGPGSLGPTARYVTDHSPAPVLLVR